MDTNPCETFETTGPAGEEAVPRAKKKRRWRQGFASTVVFLFVTWHLFFLITKNTIDLGGEEFESYAEDHPFWQPVLPIYGWTKDKTASYESTLGIDQGWMMFTSPLTRGAVFLAVRIEFADGTSTLVQSENEPSDPAHFYRVGRPRQRKLEAWLVRESNKNRQTGYRQPLWEQTARQYLRRWQDNHPNDPRTPQQLVMLRRRIAIPEPNDEPGSYQDATVRVVATFDAQGNMQP